MFNQDIIAILSKLEHVNMVLGNVYEERAYKNAIASLRLLPKNITEDNVDTLLVNVPGIGSKIFSKIKEIVSTGKCSELDYLLNQDYVKAHLELNNIAGLGPKTIDKLVKQGIKTIADLSQAVKKGKVKLTKAQQLGLRYYEDLNTRIPREEVDIIANVIRKYIPEPPGGILFEIVGSYRRGATSSGDVDILVTEKEGTYNVDLIRNFHNAVKKDPNYVDYLASGEQKISFLYKSPVEPHRVRHIDIFHAKLDEYIPYLLYATGSAYNNEYIRGLCKQHGMKLNQTGLYRVKPGGKEEKIPLSTEKDLYDILEIPYAPPENR